MASPKRRVDNCFCINVSQLQYQRLLEHPTIIGRDFVIQSTCQEDTIYLRAWFEQSDEGIRLISSVNDGWVRLDTVLVKQTQHFGGYRLWFQCRDCGKRTGKLYQPTHNDHYLCRNFHNLTYESCAVRPLKTSVPPPMLVGSSMPVEQQQQWVAAGFIEDARREYLKERRALKQYNQLLIQVS